MEDSNIEMHMGQAKWAEMAETLDDETKKKIILRRIDERIIQSSGSDRRSTRLEP